MPECRAGWIARQAATRTGGQEWSSVYNWEFQATNNQGLTPQQAMDKEFAQKGIPVELRPQLVGDGPAAG